MNSEHFQINHSVRCPSARRNKYDGRGQRSVTGGREGVGKRARGRR